MLAGTHLGVTSYVHCVSCRRSVDFSFRSAVICPVFFVGQLFLQPHLVPNREHSRYSTIGSDRIPHVNHSNRGATRSRQALLYIGKSLLMLQEIICHILIIILSVDTKLRWLFCLGKRKRSISVQYFQKFRRELKIVGVRKLTWNQVRREDPHI